MTSLDIRNSTWADIQARIDKDRKEVYEAFKRFGPHTTRELSQLSGISLLTLRPRTTDLKDLFLVELTGRASDGGIYAYVPEDVARARFEHERAVARGELNQPDLFGKAA